MSSDACDPSAASRIVELNVGGIHYTTSAQTLASTDPESMLAKIVDVGSSSSMPRTRDGRTFIDRDGVLFRFVLDYLRNGGRLVLPDGFQERERLRREAEYYRLPGLVRCLAGSSATAVASAVTTTGAAVPSSSSSETGSIVVGYRGTFAFGRDGGVADVKFRKLWRILVSGRVSLCKEVFGDSLNDSRDPDRGDAGDRYSARFFLKHSFLEQAFDALLDAGFRMVGACGSGTNSAGDMKPGMDTEESKWNHYNEFVFVRP